MTMMTTAKEIWACLSTGGDLGSLGIPRLDGRWDLRGLKVLKPTSTEVTGLPPGIRMNRGVLQSTDAVWKNIHFSNCQLEEIRFHDLTVENCVFSNCKCSGWRVWGSSFRDTRFEDVDLRHAALGGLSQDGRRNLFSNVELVRTDLRGAAFISANIVGCRFLDANLKQVNFAGTCFEDCTFSGLLDETSFDPQRFGYQHLPANEMKNVSFANARFRCVDFRKLDMDRVEWPRASDHVLVRNYRATLDCMIERLTARGDTAATRVASRMEHARKWAGDRQQTGVFCPDDFFEPGHWELALEVLAECSALVPSA